MSNTYHEVDVPSYAYIKLHHDTENQVARTIEIGPKVMGYNPNGEETGLDISPDLLIDVDENGHVLGIEILTSSTVIWDETPECESD